jgi:serine protease Do
MKNFFVPIFIFLLGMISSSVFLLQNHSVDAVQSSNKVVEKQVISEESVVTQVVKQSLPSIVTIHIDKKLSSSADPSNGLFGLFDQTSQSTPQEIQQNIGSGFIVSENGLILTNKHVVDDTSAEYKVITYDNKQYIVTDIYRDPLNDIAVLKVNATHLPPLQMGDSSNLQLGQMVVAIGTPLGELQNSVTTGVVSGLGRGITAGSTFQGSVEKLDNIIQTDAPINPGNSGGPLIDSNGQVIGINTAIDQNGQNIGFAIPVNSIKDSYASFVKNGFSYKTPYLGIRYQMLTKDQAIMNNVVAGAYVVDVVIGSPANLSGIQSGDIITNFNNISLQNNNSTSDFNNLMMQRKVGDTVTMKIWRNTKNVNVKVIIGQAPS